MLEVLHDEATPRSVTEHYLRQNKVRENYDCPSLGHGLHIYWNKILIGSQFFYVCPWPGRCKLLQSSLGPRWIKFPPEKLSASCCCFRWVARCFQPSCLETKSAMTFMSSGGAWGLPELDPCDLNFWGSVLQLVLVLEFLPSRLRMDLKNQHLAFGFCVNWRAQRSRIAITRRFGLPVSSNSHRTSIL